MSVHYKFKSALEYDTVTFDGLHISVKDLKSAIVQQKRIGKNSDFDLQVTNAQTKEVYEDDLTLIPKNTSLLIARIPLVAQPKSKIWESYGGEAVNTPRPDDNSLAAKAVDLAALDVSENDKIMAMMTQSTQDYDPSNYLKIRGATQVGQVPANYRCYKCHQPGHWIKDCPLAQGSDTIDIKKSTGIPRSFMVEVEGPQVQGAMMTPYGSYAVPALDHQAYTQKQPPSAASPLPTTKPDIPDDLVCSICSDLLSDAVMIPCCGNSFCDECIRSTLLDSEEHECPDCHDRDISPATLIPNRFLRNSVVNFKSTTGYVKRQIYKPAAGSREKTAATDAATSEPGTDEGGVQESVAPAAEAHQVSPEAPPPSSADDELPASLEKTIISEADSTDAPKASAAPPTEPATTTPAAPPPAADSPPVLPPGVSPTRDRAADAHPIVVSAPGRPHPGRARRDRTPEVAVRRGVPHQPPEERPDTPTVDEEPLPPPGILPTPSMPPQASNGADFRPNYLAGPPPPINALPMHHVQQQQPPPMHQPHHNPVHVYNQPPPHGHFAHAPPPPQGGLLPPPPMPNYRIPPPSPSSYMPPMYGLPPPPPPMNRSSEHVYDARAPMQGMTGGGGYRHYAGNGMRFRSSAVCDYQPRAGVIDDPLEAFNRMLAEKDERERRAKAMRKGRSYSRSSSRSYSRSPVRRRSPRRRTRSRSKTYTSRSHSRSYSPGHRDTSSYREYSPRRKRHSSQAPRYRASPPRSPSRYRYKDAERCRDFEHMRDQLKYPPRSAMLAGGNGSDFSYYDGYSRENGLRSKWPAPGLLPHPGTLPLRNNYYPPETISQHSHMGSYQHGAHMPAIGHRYPSRGDYPTNAHNSYQPEVVQSVQIDVMAANPSVRASTRRMDDVLPPGVDQPLPPGEEPLRYNCGSFKYPQGEWDRDADRERDRPWDRERVAECDERRSPEKERPLNRDEEHIAEERSPEKERNKSWDRDRQPKRERDGNGSRSERAKADQVRQERASKEREHRRKRSKSKSPTKRKSRRDESSPSPAKRDDKDRERRKDKDGDKHKDKEKAASDEERKKPKEKKRKRERKDSERKRKRRERKEKKDKERDKEREREEPEVGSDKNIEHAVEETIEAEITESKSPAPVTSPIEEPKQESPIRNDQEEDIKDMPIFDEKASEEVDQDSLPQSVDSKEHDSEPPDAVLDYRLTDEGSNGVLADENKDANANSYPVDRNTSISPVDINPPKVDTPDIQRENMDEKCDKDDVLELYPQGQSELDKEMLASMPEISRWEKDDESNPGILANDVDSKFDKSKVTQDVLKRAENAIFAKAINAIRPIEIKRISSDRFKLYSGEAAEKDAEEIKLPTAAEETKEEVQKVRNRITFNETPIVQTAPARISVKERLGCKVDDLDRIVLIDKPYDRQRSLSPFAKKTQELRGQRRADKDDKERDRERYDRRKDRKYRSGDRDSKERTNKDKEREADSEKHRDSGRSRRRNLPRRKSGDDRSKDASGKERLHSRSEREREREDQDKDRGKGRDRNRENKARTQSASSRKSRRTRSNDKRKRSRTRTTSRDNKRDRSRKKEKKQRREKHDKQGERHVRKDASKEKKGDSLSRSQDKRTGSGDRKKTNEQGPSRTAAKPSPTRPSNSQKQAVSSHPNQSTQSFLAPEGPALPDSVSLIASSVNPIKLSDHRKITLDEASFVPDYDAESELDEDRRKTDMAEEVTLKRHAPLKRDSSTASSSDSSSGESTRKRKKHKKHSKRKKARRDSSSSTSNSDSSSSNDDKGRKKKKHKKRSKKKKSKHKS